MRSPVSYSSYTYKECKFDKGRDDFATLKLSGMAQVCHFGYPYWPFDFGSALRHWEGSAEGNTRPSNRSSKAFVHVVSGPEIKARCFRQMSPTNAGSFSLDNGASHFEGGVVSTPDRFSLSFPCLVRKRRCRCRRNQIGV